MKARVRTVEAWPAAMDLDLAARYVSLSPQTVLNLVDRNAFPASITIPGTRRTVWLRDHLDAWLARLPGADLYPEPDLPSPGPKDDSSDKVVGRILDWRPGS